MLNSLLLYTMDYKATLTRLMRRQNLFAEEAAATMDAILAGELSEPQIAAFLIAMAAKGETVEELAGAARAMRRRATRVQAAGQVVVDTCGTGGDNSGTFNVSTTTAFVVAGAGVAVAKHGNRSVSSRCGSADVLEQLGVKIDAEPEVMEQALNEIGMPSSSRHATTPPCATSCPCARRSACARSSTCWARSPTLPAPPASSSASTRRN